MLALKDVRGQEYEELRWSRKTTNKPVKCERLFLH